MKPSEAAAPQQKVERTVVVHALSGLRFWLILWVVAFHYYYELAPTVRAYSESLPTPSVVDVAGIRIVGHGVQPRVHIAVAGFIALSGFVTHWSYKPTKCALWPLALWYMKRLDRVLFSTWFWMAFDQLASIGEDGNQASPGWSAVCYSQLAPWVTPTWTAWSWDSTWSWSPHALENCPDFPAWTVAVLIPQWLLYPLVTQPLIAVASARGGVFGLGALLAAAALLVMLPFVCTLFSDALSGDADGMRAYDFLYFSPISNIPGFFWGAVVAQLACHLAPPPAPSNAPPLTAADDAESGRAPPHTAKLAPTASSVAPTCTHFAACASLIADGCMLGLFVLTLMPLPSDLSSLVMHALLLPLSTLLFGGFFFGAAVGACHGTQGGKPSTTVGSVLRHGGVFAWRLGGPVSCALGACSFEVYLLHRPLMHVTLRLTGSQHFTSPLGVVLLAIVAWGVAKAYSIYVQDPAICAFRGLLRRCEHESKDEGSGSAPPPAQAAETATASVVNERTPLTT